MPVNATKRASILRFDDLPLQHLQATRYASKILGLASSQKIQYL